MVYFYPNQRKTPILGSLYSCWHVFQVLGCLALFIFSGGLQKRRRSGFATIPRVVKVHYAPIHPFAVQTDPLLKVTISWATFGNPNIKPTKQI